MLLLVMGASGAGKTVALREVAGDLVDVAVHDFDEIGVPAGADKQWRYQGDEEWLRRALAYQERSIDLILAGQTPLGELLAAPSAVHVHGIAAVLCDCPDEVRARRLRGREGPAYWTDERLREHDAWAAWLRGHAEDPQHRQHVLRQDAWPGMQWQRWDRWRRGDSRWDVSFIDTAASPATVADRLFAWAEDARQRGREGELGLAGRWWA